MDVVAEIECKDCGYSFSPSAMFYVCKTRPTGQCNRGLGYFLEDADRLLAAAAYLWRHGGGDAT